jgi:hypothetical protein
MPNDPTPAEIIPGANPPPGGPTTPTAGGRAPRGVQCDMCGCVLDVEGRVLKRGQEAAAYLELDDQLKKANAATTKAKERIVECETEIAALKAKLSEFTKKKSQWF